MQTKITAYQYLRAEMIKVFGGKCSYPGCNYCNAAHLELHHINGDGTAHKKSLGIDTSHRGGASNVFWAHLKRLGWPKEGLELLCPNHHREKDAALRKKGLIHHGLGASDRRPIYNNLNSRTPVAQLNFLDLMGAGV